ncbi:MAG: acetyltransferase [Planctomycetes bacterium]|nr:acetyltransferase [Planctomycetota bacterium]
MPLNLDCDRLIIVGAGGFGREMWQWLCSGVAGTASPVAGFIDRDPHCVLGHDAPPLLGDPAHYRPQAGDGLVLAIGIPGVRRRVAADLESRGGRFVTFVHPSALVARSARLGTGTIVCPLAVVSDRVVTGRGTLVNYHASLGHDSATGDYCVLSPNAALGGHSLLGNDVFLGLSASVGPGRRVGDRSKVAANSAALADVPADRLVVGVPGRLTPLVADGGSHGATAP